MNTVLKINQFENLIYELECLIEETYEKQEIFVDLTVKINDLILEVNKNIKQLKEIL